MPVIVIHDVHDSRLDRYTDLKTDRSGKPGADSFIVEGRWCVAELANSPLTTLSVVVQDGRQAEVASWYGDEVPIYVVSAQQIRELVGYDFHRGMLAEGRRPPQHSLSELDFDGPGPQVALAVFGVSQRDNLGSMIRTASALGIRRLVIDRRTADPFSRRAVRVSMGTVFKQAVFQADDPVGDLVQLADQQNVRVVATTLGEDAIPLEQFQWDGRPILLVVGSEPDGVGRQVELAATDRVTIPMQLGTDSLNVSVAAAIFMYQLCMRSSPS
ncbi:23S rRNA (guanosine-2'-O-)-methyltransferase RlmB [Rubripirellula lacrimiformis]|uniref:23S rRNA (Guanosine-2'-O-)-methyltransferase RlmB n=1 Tax=Rubripirellula lacrimiformis TaxID=1930273 RepID=A0A517NH08_9BACT|nr:RNA methyltransferase [Rubripirellula lacrimiformis]QDT06421.1 23S rRNA (guanosine-2'-O-)-methyltransferase RlmB [Rubripirellula lacrimiformis]